MNDILRLLNAQLESGRSPLEALPILRECIALLNTYHSSDSDQQLADLLKALLVTTLKPLFAKISFTSPYASRLLDSPKKLWKDSAPWSVKVLEWILDQYVKFETRHQKHVIESHFSLLAPPILSLLDDDDLAQKKAGCKSLELLGNILVNCQSDILERTGLAKVFEDSLAPNMLLLPSLTPEKQSLEILGSTYPAYRALVQASSGAGSSEAPSGAGKVNLTPLRGKSDPRRLLDRHRSRQAMLDKMLRQGILAGYIHASDNVQIAALLVFEMSHVVAMMGASSAKYLSQLLPLLRGIMMNPLGAYYPPLLKAAAAGLTQLILQCWPRIEEVWWDECCRATIGLWLSVSEEDDATASELKHDARALMQLLDQLKDPSKVQKNFRLLQAASGQLEELLSPNGSSLGVDK